MTRFKNGNKQFRGGGGHCLLSEEKQIIKKPRTKPNPNRADVQNGTRHDVAGRVALTGCIS